MNYACHRQNSIKPLFIWLTGATAVRFNFRSFVHASWPLALRRSLIFIVQKSTVSPAALRILRWLRCSSRPVKLLVCHHSLNTSSWKCARWAIDRRNEVPLAPEKLLKKKKKPKQEQKPCVFFFLKKIFKRIWLTLKVIFHKSCKLSKGSTLFTRAELISHSSQKSG